MNPKTILSIAFTIIALNSFSQISQQWKKDFGVDTSSNEYVSKLLLDGNQSIIECGYYQSAIDSTGNASFIVKYDLNGLMQWNIRHHGPVQFAEQINDAAIDYQNNIICVGSYAHNNGSNDFLILKYSPSGSLLFIDTIDGTAQLNDIAYRVCIDGFGGIYVTGSTETAPGQNESRTLKLSSSGSIVWDHQSPVVTNCKFMLLDNQGNITLTGSHGDLAPVSFVIEQIDNSGNTIWSKHFQPDLASTGVSISSDGSGNNYVAANLVYDPSSNDGDIWLMKFNNLGDTMWSRIINVSDSFIDAVSTMKILNNKIYLCGYSKSGNQNYLQNFLTTAVDTNGNQLWMDTVNGQTNKEDYASDLMLEPYTHQILVIGTTRNLGAEFNWLIQAYDTTGVRQSQTIIDNGYADDGKFIAPTSSGYFVCSGTNTYVIGHQDATVILFSTLPLFIGGAIDENKISFFPQPCPSSIQINADELNGNMQLNIYNLNGQTVYQSDIHSGIQNLKLDFASGTYLYCVYQNGKLITSGKLVKQ